MDPLVPQVLIRGRPYGSQPAWTRQFLGRQGYGIVSSEGDASLETLNPARVASRDHIDHMEKSSTMPVAMAARYGLGLSSSLILHKIARKILEIGLSLDPAHSLLWVTIWWRLRRLNLSETESHTTTRSEGFSLFPTSQAKHSHSNSEHGII